MNRIRTTLIAFGSIAALAAGGAGTATAAAGHQSRHAGTHRCARPARHAHAGRAAAHARRHGASTHCAHRHPKGEEPAAPLPGRGSGEGAAEGTPQAPGEELVQSAALTEAEHFRFFGSGSPWNVAVAAGASLDPNSAAIVGSLAAEIAKAQASGGSPHTVIETSNYSVPVYTVGAGQPNVAVTVSNPRVGSALRGALSSVPLPANAKPAEGTDGLLALWQPSTDKLWEFWRLVHEPGGGWSTSFGGAMQNVSKGSGVFGPESWPGASTSWGASSCSMSIVGGLITLEDLKLGRINHALMLGINAPRAGVYSLPAQRTDGFSTNPNSLPEGAHLRLDPKLNLAALKLPKMALMIAEAAQRYGMFVCLKGKNVGFYAQDPTPTGTNPYTGPGGYYECKSPEQVMANFPWSHAQLLKMKLRRARPRPAAGH